MAILEKPLFGTEAKGRIRNTLLFLKRVANKNYTDPTPGEWFHITSKLSFPEVPTPPRVEQKTKFQEGLQTWRPMSQSQKDYWETQATGLQTGYNAFLKNFLLGGPPVTTITETLALLNSLSDIPIVLHPMIRKDFGGTPRQFAAAASLGTKIYLGSGYDQDYRKDWWEYDPSTDTWTQKTDFGGTARISAVAVGQPVFSKIYMGTGAAPANAKDWWEYNPSTDLWTQKTDFGGSARYAAVAAALESKVYVGTGMATDFTKDWWEYNPSTDLWTQKADLPGPARYGAVAAASGSKIYVGLGDASGFANDWWEYDPPGDSWTQKTNFPGSPRYLAVAAPLGDKVYVGLGDDGAYKKDIWEYNPSTNSWIEAQPFGGSARYSAVAAALEDKLFIGTGMNAGLKGDWFLQKWNYT